MNFHQAKNWVDLGDWGKGMDEFKLPSSDELAGKEIKLRFYDSNRVVICKFYDAKSLAWGASESLEKRHFQTETYEAIRIAPDIYFVDFVNNTNTNVSVSIALDLNTRKATVLTATLPDRKKTNYSFLDRLGKDVDLSTIKVEIQHALINPSSPDEPILAHERTSDLLGKRIKYTYSHNRVYEHIYLNERFYTWHCLVGAEAGLADTEICDYFKIAPDIYLFSWREKIMPTYGLVLINLKEMRSNGKTFGLDITSGEYINFTMGSTAELVSVIKPL
jgi:hypothetical protein